MSSDIDLETLSLFVEAPGLVECEEAARRLGCDESEARRRLDGLVGSGHLAGPMLVRWGDREWSEIGYGLLSRGSDALTSAK